MRFSEGGFICWNLGFFLGFDFAFFFSFGCDFSF